MTDDFETLDHEQWQKKFFSEAFGRALTICEINGQIVTMFSALWCICVIVCIYVCVCVFVYLCECV